MKRERLSRTSQLIAASLLYAAARPELARFIPSEDLELYRKRLPLCSGYARRLAVLSHPGVRLASGMLEKFLLPGIVAHYVIRKLILWQIAEQAVRAEGLRQVVILGAGLDLLGRRLAVGFPELTVFETDRAQSIAMKEMLLGRDHPGNLVLHPHDLDSTPVEDALQSAQGFARDRPTMVLAEGMLMYCPLEEVRRLFLSLQVLFAHPLRLVFTFMEADPCGRVRFRGQSPLVAWWLTRSGEAFRWGMSADAMALLLSQAGFALDRTVDSAAFAAEQNLLPANTVPPAGGELIAVARS